MKSGLFTSFKESGPILPWALRQLSVKQSGRVTDKFILKGPQHSDFSLGRDLLFNMDPTWKISTEKRRVEECLIVCYRTDQGRRSWFEKIAA